MLSYSINKITEDLAQARRTQGVSKLTSCTI
jgi:hypothetical protein